MKALVEDRELEGLCEMTGEELDLQRMSKSHRSMTTSILSNLALRKNQSSDKQNRTSSNRPSNNRIQNRTSNQLCSNRSSNRRLGKPK